MKEFIDFLSYIELALLYMVEDFEFDFNQIIKSDNPQYKPNIPHILIILRI